MLVRRRCSNAASVTGSSSLVSDSAVARLELWSSTKSDATTGGSSTRSFKSCNKLSSMKTASSTGDGSTRVPAGTDSSIVCTQWGTDSPIVSMNGEIDIVGRRILERCYDRS